MPKKSVLAREEKRKRLVSKNSAKRAQLKKEGDYEGLANLSKLGSPAGLSRRCWSCGRKRFHMRRFELCRICFRDKASSKQIPGVKKASW